MNIYNNLLLFGKKETIKKIFDLISNDLVTSETIDFKKLIDLSEDQEHLFKVEGWDYNNSSGKDKWTMINKNKFSTIDLIIISKSQPLNENLYNALKNQFDVNSYLIYYNRVSDFDHNRTDCGGKINYNGIKFEDQQCINSELEFRIFLKQFDDQLKRMIEHKEQKQLNYKVK